jgi:hypothetical protein
VNEETIRYARPLGDFNVVLNFMQLCGVSGTRKSLDNRDKHLHTCLAVDVTLRAAAEGSSPDEKSMFFDH